MTDVYDDFTTRGGAYGLDEYHDHWFASDRIPGFAAEPEALRTRTRGFPGALHLEATPFRTSRDSTLDHAKYFAQSTAFFDIPDHGSITFSADIDATTSGTDPTRQICPAPHEDEPCKTVLEPQQAAATFHVLNIHETGQLFDWFVGEETAFCLTERLLAPVVHGVGLDEGYTQIIETVDISPGTHTYSIRYRRSPAGVDHAEWLLDGDRVARQQKVGIPPDVQQPGRYRDVTWPSIDATGEPLRDRMDTFNVGHGLFSLLDEFPFHPTYGDRFVSFPEDERIFGQGVDATFDRFEVATTTREH